MKINNLLLILIFFLLLHSCQSIKDGLSGSKNNNSDEFLVKKKNPLILPPKYLKLPKPADSTYDEEQVLNETNIEQLVIGNKNKGAIAVESYGSAEEFVLRNIKNN